MVTDCRVPVNALLLGGRRPDQVARGLGQGALAAWLAGTSYARWLALRGEEWREGDAESAPPGRLITLNMGLGRDSITMLLLLLEGSLVAEGQTIRAADVDAVLFSDTGAEWEHTEALLTDVRLLCEAAGVRFLHLAKPDADVWKPWAEEQRTAREAAGAGWEAVADRDLTPILAAHQEQLAQLRRGRDAAVKGAADPAAVRAEYGGLIEAAKREYASRARALRAPFTYRATQAPWAYQGESTEERAADGSYHLRPPILEDFAHKATIAARADKSCTGNHKVLPLRRALEDLARERFGPWATNRAWSQAVKRRQRAPHLSLIGYAADEAQRLSGAEDGCFSALYTVSAYPLAELGINKADEAAILERYGFGHVRKSGCWMCPFQPIGWWWALSQTSPDRFARAVEYERVAAARTRPVLRVLGSEPLDVAVRRWRERHPTATVEEILDKTYSKACDAPRANPAREACPRCRLSLLSNPVPTEATMLALVALAHKIHLPGLASWLDGHREAIARQLLVFLVSPPCDTTTASCVVLDEVEVPEMAPGFKIARSSILTSGPYADIAAVVEPGDRDGQIRLVRWLDHYAADRSEAAALAWAWDDRGSIMEATGGDVSIEALAEHLGLRPVAARQPLRVVPPPRPLPEGAQQFGSLVGQVKREWEEASPLSPADRAVAEIRAAFQGPLRQLGARTHSVRAFSVLGGQSVIVDWFRLPIGAKPLNGILENEPGFRFVISSRGDWPRGGLPSGKTRVEMVASHGARERWGGERPRFRAYTSRQTGLLGLEQVTRHLLAWFAENQALLLREPPLPNPRELEKVARKLGLPRLADWAEKWKLFVVMAMEAGEPNTIHTDSPVGYEIAQLSSDPEIQMHIWRVLGSYFEDDADPRMREALRLVDRMNFPGRVFWRRDVEALENAIGRHFAARGVRVFPHNRRWAAEPMKLGLVYRSAPHSGARYYFRPVTQQQNGSYKGLMVTETIGKERPSTAVVKSVTTDWQRAGGWERLFQVPTTIYTALQRAAGASLAEHLGLLGEPEWMDPADMDRDTSQIRELLPNTIQAQIAAGWIARHFPGTRFGLSHEGRDFVLTVDYAESPAYQELVDPQKRVKRDVANLAALESEGYALQPAPRPPATLTDALVAALHELRDKTDRDVIPEYVSLRNKGWVEQAHRAAALAIEEVDGVLGSSQISDPVHQAFLSAAREIRAALERGNLNPNEPIYLREIVEKGILDVLGIVDVLGEAGIEGAPEYTAPAAVPDLKWYQAFYKGKRLSVQATTSFNAQEVAAAQFKAKRRSDVSVVPVGDEDALRTR